MRMAIKISDLLIQGIKNQNEKAFEEVVAILKPAITNLCHKFVYDEPAVQEVVWKTFLVVWVKAETFKGQSAFSSWVYRIAVNECLMHLRKDRFSARRFLGSPDEEQEILESRLTYSPHDLLIAKEVILNIKKILKEKYYSSFKKKLILYSLGRSQKNTAKEIARDLGCSIPRIKSALHRNRENIAKQLAINE